MDLLQFYKTVRSASLDMVTPLRVEDFIPQPAYFASPPKWNLGHTSWFFEEMVLKRFVENYKPFDPGFAYIFNSYYTSLGNRISRNSRGDLSRPTVNEVLDYRHFVDNKMVDLLRSVTNNAELEFLVALGLNHEQQHQELFFTDLKYAFGVNPLFPAYGETAFCEEANGSHSGFEAIDGGVYSIGYSGDGFCYDNEKPLHKHYLHPYKISKRLVTNGEYIEFIKDGGYENSAWWHDDALPWLAENQLKMPLYWHEKEGDWHQFTLAGLKRIQPDHILTHISYYEAYAFASWKGLRLPTEFEWEVASDRFNWGKRWEWTESAYLPYPGYKRAEGALGEYNGKFMVNQMVLRGASVVTPKNHSRKTYRNFFHPQMGYQFTGIRLAQ